MPVNFSSLMNKPVGEVKRPVALPQGTYYGVISGHELVESGKKKTPGVQINGTLTHAHEDVDLNRSDDGQPLDPNGKRFPRSGTTFWISEDSEYRLVDFITSFGIEPSNYGQMLPQLAGQSVMLDIIEKPIVDESTGESRMVNEVARMAAAK